MIIHIFNSSLISGPETLVLPALAQLNQPIHILWLRELRKPAENLKQVEDYFQRLKLPWTAIDVHARYDKTSIADLTQALLKILPLRTGSENNYDVIHAHDVKPSVYLAAAAKALKGSRHFKTVTTHHGVRARSGFRARFYELYYSNRVATQFDRVLCVCTDDFARLVKRGIDPKRLQVHLNGVTRTLITSAQRSIQQKEIRSEWRDILQRLEPTASFTHGPLLGVAARLDHEKRHFYLLQILNRIRELEPNWSGQVLCFGRGPLEDKLRAETQRLGLGAVIKWMGYREGLGEEMAGFDALLSLSSAEGLPINLIEAGWAATPVFSTAVDGVKDLFAEDAAHALLTPQAGVDEAAKKLLKFLFSETDLRAKGAELQETVRTKFSSEVWLNQLRLIYRELGVAETQRWQLGDREIRCQELN